MTMDPTRPDQPEPQPAPDAEPEPVPASDSAAEVAAEAVPTAEAHVPEASRAPEPAAAPEPTTAPVAAPTVVVAAAPPPAAPPAPTWQAPSEPPGPFPGVKFADHGKRLVSYILDVIFVALLTTGVAIALVVLIGIFVSLGIDFLAVLSGISLFIAIFAVSLIYWPYFWVKSGQTPGMKLVGGLRVVMDKDGGRVTTGPAILRVIGFFIDTIVFGLPIGFAWILVDSRRRAWHDLIAGTVVIQEG